MDRRHAARGGRAARVVDPEDRRDRRGVRHVARSMRQDPTPDPAPEVEVTADHLVGV